MRRPWDTPHMPGDTVLPLHLAAEEVYAACSRKPVDAADRVAGLFWVARATGVARRRVALLHQIHGTTVVRAPWEGFPSPVDGDVLVTTERDLPLAVRIADCVPLALAAPAGGGIAMVHAGWRGAASGVVAAGVKALCEAAGCAPDALCAALGPSIGPCCYETGPEFADRFEERWLTPRGDRFLLDLPGFVGSALGGAGVGAAEISTAGAWCTACGRGAPEGVTLHSHRGSGGAPGRNIAFVVQKERA